MCKVIREGDEMACSCGLRWDVDEPDPHTDINEKSKKFIDDMSVANSKEIIAKDDPQILYDTMRKFAIELYDKTPDNSNAVIGFMEEHAETEVDVEEERSVVNGHVLYRDSDFNRETEFTTLGIAVIDGGLQVCKICGEYESGLSNPCKGEA